MAQLDDIAVALKNADAAGDTEAAQQLADAYRVASAQTTAPAAPASPQYPIAPQNMPLLSHTAGTPWEHPVSTPPAPSWAQVGHENEQFGKGLAVGVPSAVIGTPGDIESIARAGLSKVSRVSPESFLPTTQDVGDFIAGPASSPEDAMGRNIGGLIGPFGEVEAAKAAIAAGKATAAPVTQIMKAAKAARQSGFVLPPKLIGNQSLTTSIAEAGAGKAKLAQSASAANQDVTNAMAAKDLGLPPDTAITDATLNQVKSKAGQKYQAVADSVPKGVRLRFDTDFVDAINALGDSASPAGQEFPAIVSNDKIDALKNALLNDVAPDGTVTPKAALSPAAGIDLVRKLRAQANTNFKALGDPAAHGLAIAQRDAANAVDDLVERRLTQIGKPDVVKDYQAARQMLAKAYDVEAATNTENGNVSARGLARLLQNGKPMSGELQKVAEAASAFPHAFQNPATFGGAENLSALDYFMTAAALPHHPSLAAAIVGRPLMRSRVLSPGFQDRMVGIAPTTPSGMSVVPSMFAAGAIRYGAPAATAPQGSSPTLGLTPTPLQRVVQ